MGDSGVAKAHEGACKEGDKGCNCPNYNDPVCGRDFITYNNPCSLHCQLVLRFLFLSRVQFVFLLQSSMRFVSPCVTCILVTCILTWNGVSAMTLTMTHPEMTLCRWRGGKNPRTNGKVCSLIVIPFFKVCRLFSLSVKYELCGEIRTNKWLKRMLILKGQYTTSVAYIFGVDTF